MRVRILGPLEVVADGELVEIGGARLRALLIRLALDAGHLVTVDSLASALWPDDRPADPANALQTLVSRLRRALKGNPRLQSAHGGYRLDLAPEAVDAIRFERLAREGRRALRNGEAEIAANRLGEALGLWRGEALADVVEAPFAAPAVVRLEELRLTATEDRLEAELLAAPEQSHLVAELEELSAAHPLRERLRVLLVKALHANGRQAEALTAYEEFRRLLADELGADPGPELQAAHLAMLRGEKVPARPISKRSRGNLRAALTSFVGRAQEQTRIGRQLVDGRLVTLVGPGGAGKTRLATALAGTMAGDIPGGVWLVELAPVTDPDDVPQTVIGALGLREARMLDLPGTPRDPISRLVEALSTTETLIVLDNCEHLIDAAAHLADELLGRCPRLRILATSREPLGILGEALCPVTPLGLPVPGAPAAEALASPAVRLFADRAAAVRPDFTVTDGNVAAVAEICRRLDGLPLAIELAAARLRALPVEQVAARLDDRFRLLTGGGRTALPRHRTLRAVIDWSWDLLTDDEQRLAQRLAALPGGASMESAEVVAGATLDHLTALMDKSLLQFDGGRYWMLETIREYGLEKLADSGQTSEVRAAHAAYCLDLAQRAEPHLRGGDQAPWLRTLMAEHNNLVAALHFACGTSDAATAVGLASALGLWWTIQGNHAEAASRLRLALEVAGNASEEAKTVATVFYLLNTVLSGSSRADITVGEVRERAHRADRDTGHPASALIEPALALVSDDTVHGLAAIDRRLSHPDPWTRAMLRLMRALLEASNGGIGAMRRDLTGAVTAFREAGERWGLAHSLTYLAYDQIMLGDFNNAIAGLEESICLLRELDADDDAVLQRVLLAMAHVHGGDVEPARALLLEIVASNVGSAYARITLGDLARYDGDLEEAARQYRAANDDLSRAPFDAPPFRAMLASAMGQLATATGELGAARRHLEEAITLAIEVPDPPIVAGIGVAVARLRLRQGSADGAAQLLGAAHALRGASDSFNPDVIRLVQQLRGGLGERAFDAAYAFGAGLDRTGALALVEAQVRRR